MSMAENEAEGEVGAVHVVFLPWWSTSHIIPLVQIARLFAATQNARVTIITTPYNALLFQSSINHSISSGHQITIHTLSFPASQVGLPEGIEKFCHATSPGVGQKLYQAFMLLQKPTEQLIYSLRPDCIFSDMFFPWSADVAANLNIPRLLFYPSNYFYHSVAHNLKVFGPHESVKDDNEKFDIPFLPDKIRMKKCQIQSHIINKTPYGDLINAIRQSESQSYGLVHYTFYELEPTYYDYYKKNVAGAKCDKLWCIGPLSQYWNIGGKKVLKEKQVSHITLTWLDTQRSKSVLYVCFGSMTKFREAQLTEIALALEAASQSFIWVVGKLDEGRSDDNWLPRGYEERNKEKGMIVRGWVPQAEILRHPAICGFLTHCGWNSVLEAITEGVPMITWPLFSEQFYNEKLITEVWGIGVAEVGSEVWNQGFNITAGPIIGKEKIENAVRKLMMMSESARANLQEKMRVLSTMAKKAVEPGGSSYNNLMDIIQEIKICALKNRKQDASIAKS